MKARDIERNEAPDMGQEQDELLALMEKSIDPSVLAAVEEAYHWADEDLPAATMEISYGGTAHA